MLNAKGDNICELCFSPSEAAVCPNCTRAKRPMYYGCIPTGTSLAGRYISGLLLTRNNISTDYLCYDTKNDMRVVISEYFPLRWAHRDSGSVAVNYHSEEMNRLYLDALNVFCSESEALIGLGRNKYLAEVLMSFREHNTAYRVTRYYGTRTLESYMLQIKDKLSPELSVTAACQTAFGLFSLHNAGLVHGDISPENIIICNDGSVKLKGIFGNCRSYSARTGCFSDIIRPGYSSAELYKKDAVVTKESDYYAIGSLLYFMLTGNELADSITRLENGGIVNQIDNLSTAVMLILGRLLSVSERDRESGFRELMNIAPQFGVAPQYSPSAASASSPSTSVSSDYKQESLRKDKEAIDAGFNIPSSFTERIPQIDGEETEEGKKSSLKKGLFPIIIIILVIAAALAGIAGGYLKLYLGGTRPVNNSVTITADPRECTTEKEISTKEMRTTSENITEETVSACETTQEVTTDENTTAEKTTAEHTTDNQTTVDTTEHEADTTRMAYSITNDYQVGIYSTVGDVRARTSPDIDLTNNNVVTLVPGGSRVTVSAVYDMGLGSGEYRYWGYVRYQGSRYYYDGYVPMSSLKIVS